MTTHKKLLVFCLPIPVDVVSAVTDVLQPIVREMELRYDTLTGGTALWGLPLEEVPAGRPFVPLDLQQTDGICPPLEGVQPGDRGAVTHVLLANPEPHASVQEDGRYPCNEDGCLRAFDTPGQLGGHKAQHTLRRQKAAAAALEEETRSGPVAPSEFDDAGGDAGPEQQSDTATRPDPICPLCGEERPTILQLSAHVDVHHLDYTLMVDAAGDGDPQNDRAWQVQLPCPFCDLLWDAADDNHRAEYDQHLEEIHGPELEEAEQELAARAAAGPDVDLVPVVVDDVDTSDSIEPDLVGCPECDRPYSRERLARHLRIDHRWSAEVADEEARTA